MTIAIPLLIKFGIPLATYAIGHLIGFLHGRHSKTKEIATNVKH